MQVHTKQHSNKVREALYGALSARHTIVSIASDERFGILSVVDDATKALVVGRSMNPFLRQGIVTSESASVKKWANIVTLLPSERTRLPLFDSLSYNTARHRRG